MCVGVTLWFGWGGVVSVCRLQPAYGYHTIVVKFVCEFFGCDCYYMLIFIELHFSNFRPLTCFSVMIPEAV